MGKGEGEEEDSLSPFLWARKRDSHLGRVIRLSHWWHTKTGAWAVRQHRIFFQLLY
jgi:hypothetical protein